MGIITKGITAGSKTAGKAAAKTDQEALVEAAKAADRVAAGKRAADVAKATDPMKLSEALGGLNLEGKGKLKVTQSDRTRVGGGNIGGAMFPGLSQVDPFYEGLVWGVGKKGTASSLIRQSDPNTVWSTILGKEDQLKSNPIVFNRLFDAFKREAKAGLLDDELRQKINAGLEPTFGEGVDILDPKFRQKVNTFDKRVLVADLLLGKGIGGELRGGSIIPGSAILRQETEPVLLHPKQGGDVPTFAVGPRLFSLSGDVKERPDLHPGFPFLLTGEDKGMVFKPVPGEEAMIDFMARMQEAGKKPGYYEWTMGEAGRGLPSQDITEEYLTHLQKKGYAGGGMASPEGIPPIVSDLEAQYQAYQLGGAVKTAAAAGTKVANKATKNVKPPAFGGSYDNSILRRAKEEFITTYGMDIGQGLSKDYDFVDINKLKLSEKVEEPRVKKLMNAILNEDPFNTKIPPVVIDSEGNVLDGHHRIEAARRLGITNIPAIEKFDIEVGPKFLEQDFQSYAAGGPVKMQDGGSSGSISATPQNPLLGALAKFLKVREEATSKLNSPTATLLDFILPTSETVEKLSYGDPLFRMPQQSNIPITTDKPYVAETIGMMPFVPPAGRAAQRGAEALGTAATRAVTGKPDLTADQIYRAMADTEAITKLGAPGVVKPKGGQWLAGDVEKQLSYLKPKIGSTSSDPMRVLAEMESTYTPDVLDTLGPVTQDIVIRSMAELQPKVALQRFIEGPMTRYLKTEMGTEGDPIRLMADENILKASQEYEAGLKQVKKAYDRVEQIKAEGPRSDRPAGTWENAIEAQKARADRMAEELEEKVAFDQRHALPFQMPELAPFQMADVKVRREDAGFKPSGSGKTNLGLRYEALTDRRIQGTRAGDLISPNFFLLKEEADEVLAKNPWLYKVDPETRVYSLNTGVGEQNTGFKHITDELANSMNPNSGLPANLLRTPEQVATMSMEKAARHVIEIDKWRAMQKAEADALRAEKAAFTIKEYPDTPKKLRWVELKMGEYPKELPSGFEIVNTAPKAISVRRIGDDGRGAVITGTDIDDVVQGIYKNYPDTPGNPRKDLEDALKYEGEVMQHCVGGYCPDVVEGRSRIYSLRDKKGEPHVTIEVLPNPQPYPVSGEEFAKLDSQTKAQYREYVRQWRQRHPDVEDLTDEHVAMALAEAGVPPRPPMIEQIKGKGNRKPTNQYLPMVQDFINDGQWSQIKDVENAGLRQADQTFINAAKEEGIDVNIVGENKGRFLITEEENDRIYKLMLDKRKEKKKDGDSINLEQDLQTYKDGGNVQKNKLSPEDEFALQMTVGTLPNTNENQSLLDQYLAFRERRMEELAAKDSINIPNLPGANIVKNLRPGIFGAPGHFIGNEIARAYWLPKDIRELYGIYDIPEEFIEIKNKAEGGPVHMQFGGQPPTDEIGYMMEAIDPTKESTGTPVYDALKFLAPQVAKSLVSPAVGIYGTLTSGKFGSPEGIRAGEAAMEKFMEPSKVDLSPEAIDVLGNIGKFAEELETKYKLPPLMPELFGPVMGATQGITPQIRSLASQGMTKAREAVSELPNLPVGMSIEAVGPGGKKLTVNELIQMLEAGEEMTPEQRQRAEYSKAQKEKYAAANVAKAQREPTPQAEEVRVPANESGFFSSVEKAAANLTRKQGTGDAFLSDIQKFDPSAGELEATGIVDFLKGKKSITRQEVQDYINSNKVEIEEVIRGRDILSVDERNKLNDIERAVSKGWYDVPQEDLDWYEATKQRILATPPARFDRENLILPGGTNYKEILLKLPTKANKDLPWVETDDGFKATTNGLEVYVSKSDDGTWFAGLEGTEYVRGAKSANEAKKAIQERLIKDLGAEGEAELSRFTGNFITKHWPDDPNTMAHLRMQDMTIGGKKTLVVEEIQSDWHQEGRRKGYNKVFDMPNMDAEELLIKHGNEMTQEQKDWLYDFSKRWAYADQNDQDILDKFVDEYETWIATQKLQTVPDAPFKKDWYQLGMKRVMKYAADNDYDQIALVGPEEQIRRGSLGTFVDGLYFQKNPDGSIKLEAEKGGSVVLDKTVKPEDLELYVGKDVAKKILNTKDQDGTLSGGDLEIGGEGMRQYYDRNYPDYMNKLGSKYKTKANKINYVTKEFEPDDVEEVDIGEVDRFGRPVMAYRVVDRETGDEVAFEYNWEKALAEANKKAPSTSMWVMDLPAKMKSDVKVGQPFKSGGAVKKRNGGPIYAPFNTMPDISDSGQIIDFGLRQELGRYA